jgi:hypothetical protein
MKLQLNLPFLVKSSIVLTLLIVLIPVVFNGINYSCKIEDRSIDPEELNSINSLSGNNYYEEARKELIAAIKKSSPSPSKILPSKMPVDKKEALKKPIPQKLCYLAENSFNPNWGQFDKSIDERIDNITKMKILGTEWRFSDIRYWLKNMPLIIEAIIALCILWYCFSYKTIHLNIEDFNDESIDLKIGKGTTSTLKTLFLENELGTNNAVNVAISPVEKLESPIENKEITILLKLINWVFSSSSTLSGYYQKSRKKGIGLKLVLKNSKGEIFKEDFWQQDYDTANKPGDKYLHELLAIPASIWVMSRLNGEKFENWLGFNRNPMKPDNKDHQKYNSWKSFTYSRVGSYWYLKDNSDKLEEMLHKSLMYNSNNRFALFTLGVLKMEQAIERKESSLFDEAEKSLKEAERLSDLIRSPDLKFSTSPVWYKSIFQLLSIELYKEPLSRKKITNEEFLEKGKKLVTAVEYYQDTAKKNSFPSSDFLDEFEVMARILYASILVDLNESKHEEQINEIKLKYYLASFDKSGNLLFKGEKQHNDKMLLLNPLVYYNLACYYALCLERSEEPQKHKEKEKMFLYLKYAVKQNKKLNKWAGIDPSFTWIRKYYKLEFYDCTENLELLPFWRKNTGEFYGQKPT